MIIRTFKNTQDSRVVDKKPTMLQEFNVILKDGTNINAPTIIINDITMDDLVAFNYLYIPKFGRYYFCNTPTLTNGKRIEVSCKCDVLMSFKKDIKQSTQLVMRNEYRKNKMLRDANWIRQDNVQLISQDIFEITRGASLVLQTTGSGEGAIE